MSSLLRSGLRLFLLCALLVSARADSSGTTPIVGEAAPNFSLRGLDGAQVELTQLTSQTQVVLVVLRGWPGYQCPLCTRQVHDFVTHARDFVQRDARVLMVYPGPADQLKAHAQEFVQDKSWPPEFVFVIDPDFTFTNAYGLRWNAPNETAYPATFIIDRENRVKFAQISKSHGDRTDATAVLEQLTNTK
ncbi:MAG: peroxiredoxin family protein [Opitutus sp.]